MQIDEKRKLTATNSLRAKIQHYGYSPTDAYQDLKEEYELNEVPQAVFKALDEAYSDILAEIRNIETLTMVSSFRTKREPWYAGPKDEDPAWAAYRAHLIAKGWDETVDSIDISSTNVVSLLNCPGLSKFSGRGLVLGYVQSGKTANMTAVIAKAADAGYRLIIVLTGMIEKLREQTQVRLEGDLLAQPDSGKWHRWTTIEDDFRHPANPGFQFNLQDRNIVVLKKNAAILKRLLNKLENTSGPELAKCPVLIIDDECDQASVNSPSGSNTWTAINRQIRLVLDYFPRASYVGYTATPFANVLIDPNIDPDKPEDLYPRDFIYSLPRPENYFGAERIFGRQMLDADTEPLFDEELDVIREVPTEEILHLRPKGKKVFEFEVTASLEEAILYYLVATSLRNLRGARSEHSTMLIHTSQKVDVHSQIYLGVKIFLNYLQGNLQKEKLKIRNIWEREKLCVPPELFELQSTDFNSLWKNIKASISDVELVVENSRSGTDRIDYMSATPEAGCRYICIGGNVLARGLTLEGLVTSYFVRTASQYDTLMQMGRWFGYRQGYEDLPRVWMTADLSEKFLLLATVEADIRYQIANYEKSDLTPSDLALRIRKFPGLAITAKNKMLAAKAYNLSFGGQHRQTTRFYRKDKNILAANWNAGARLVDQCQEVAPYELRNQGLLFRAMDRTLIEEFLTHYRIHDSQADLINPDSGENHLLDYIDRCKQQDGQQLKNWNIALVQPHTSKSELTTLGSLPDLKTINRSMFQPIGENDADIKALMSRSDIRIDLDHEPSKNDWKSIKEERQNHSSSSCPLLLLYLIDPDSMPKKRKQKPGVETKQRRKPLEAVSVVLGFGIVFPEIVGYPEPSYHVAVEIPDLEDAVEDDEALLDESEETL